MSFKYSEYDRRIFFRLPLQQNRIAITKSSIKSFVLVIAVFKLKNYSTIKKSTSLFSSSTLISFTVTLSPSLKLLLVLLPIRE